VPDGVARPRGGKEPFKGRDIAYATYDRGLETLRARLVALGGKPRRGVTLPTTLAMARRRGHLAVVPRSGVADQLLDGERVLPLPFRYRLTLSVVTGTTPDLRLLRILPAVRRELGMTAPR
jgi:hypothetical protein